MVRSSRRAARGTPTATPGGVPVSLTDRLHPAWQDPAAFENLCADTGVWPRSAMDLDLVKAPWWARFDAFRRAWCLANGYEHPQWPNTIDYQRATAAGIDMHSTSRYRLRVVSGE